MLLLIHKALWSEFMLTLWFHSNLHFLFLFATVAIATVNLWQGSCSYLDQLAHNKCYQLSFSSHLDLSAVGMILMGQGTLIPQTVTV